MTDAEKYDSVLLIGFGGPTPGCCKRYEPCPSEAYCFVEGIVGTAPTNAGRVREVASHYAALGGFSPFNALTFKQADALRAALKGKGIDIPVYAGMRNWSPYLREVIADMVHHGHRNPLGIILSPYQSKASWERYQNDVETAIEVLDVQPPTINYLAPWYTDSRFINAIADRIRTSCRTWETERFNKAALIFTAHSIPQPAARTSPYTQQFHQTASAVAQTLGKVFDIAYQSSPDNSTIPWTGPDINDLIEEKKVAGIEDIVLSPIGFLCDHVEVLYDLDIEAKETAQRCGIGFIRAGTVGDHPEFIDMLASRVYELWR